MLVVYRVSIILQLSLAVGYTYHRSRLIRASFLEQRLEKERNTLVAQHRRLEQRYLSLQHGAEVAAYAREQGMVPARVNNVHRMAS